MVCSLFGSTVDYKINKPWLIKKFKLLTKILGYLASLSKTMLNKLKQPQLKFCKKQNYLKLPQTMQTLLIELLISY